MNKVFKISLEKRCQAVSDSVLRQSALTRLNTFAIKPDEEDFLTKLLPLDMGDINKVLDVFEVGLKDLRGNSPESVIWWDFKDIDAINFFDPNFGWSKFTACLTRSLYMWNGGGSFSGISLRLLNKLEEVSEGDFLFTDFPEPFKDICTRASLLLIFDNFPILPVRIQLFLLRSELLFFAITLGLDLNDAVSRATNYFLVLGDRLEFSRLAATFLISNNSIIGVRKDNNEPSDVKYWVDQFGIFSGHKYDGLSLMNFFADKTQWGNNGEIDRETIKIVLSIVSFLFTKPFLQNIDDQIKANVDVGKIVNTKTEPKKIEQKKTPEITVAEAKRQVGDSSDPELVLNKLQELSEKYDNPEILGWYYFDEQTNEFKWRE